MFLFLIAVGCCSIITGYICIFRPDTIIKLSQLGNRMIVTDYGYVQHHIVSGVILVIIGAVLFYVGVTVI